MSGTRFRQVFGIGFRRLSQAGSDKRNLKPDPLRDVPVTIRQCYTCRHYRQMQEKIVLRDQKGEKTGTRQIYVDRCAARNLAELRVPVVDGEPVGLVLRAEFEKMLTEAKVERRPIPFMYGSEAHYHQGDAVIECPNFELKERLFKHEAV